MCTHILAFGSLLGTDGSLPTHLGPHCLSPSQDTTLLWLLWQKPPCIYSGSRWGWLLGRRMLRPCALYSRSSQAKLSLNTTSMVNDVYDTCVITLSATVTILQVCLCVYVFRGRCVYKGQRTTSDCHFSVTVHLYLFFDIVSLPRRLGWMAS